MRFDRILLATDHTDFDAGAERVAFDLASRRHLRLQAVVPFVSNPEFEAAAPRQFLHDEQLACDKVEDLRRLAAARPVALEASARSGEEPWRAIVDEAQQQRADLLVMRRRGKQGFLANLLIGETVNRAAAHAACPVLLVPRAGAPWRRRILAALDGPDTSDAVARAAAELAAERAIPCTLACSIVADTHAARTDAEALLTRVRLGAEVLYACSTRVLVGPAPECIVDAARADAADLIVIGRRRQAQQHRPVLCSLAQKLVGLYDGPVLLV